MDRAAIAHGWKIATAAEALSRSRTLRLLAREPKVSFSDMVEEWIAGCGESATMSLDGARILPFIDGICEREGIPNAFYRGFASLEFAETRHDTH
jgi:hypothetical protein